MITSRRVALDGEQLDEVDSRIIIQGMETRAGKDTFGTVTPYGRPGQRVTAAHRDSMDIVVRFSIRIKKTNMAERSAVMDKVNAWAGTAENAAWLTTNERSGQRIRVRVVQYPDAGDQWNWTGTYAITFRAYDIPYWQDITPNIIRRAGAQNLSLNMNIEGNTETVMDVTFVNTGGGTINQINIRTGKAKMSFTGLELGNGQTFAISHTEGGRIIATKAGESCLARRTEDSDDDIWIAAGMSAVVFTADGPGTLTITASGRYV